ncbi:MAG TPA: AbrB/MazE/SpoVT family DNA-binding domain-containing protein [Acidimicrobiales bacterium]|nr:AbrB/MazE/SpoVT family DNA-binding domain-containing protein [Acidimicrobiales bacterium]
MMVSIDKAGRIVVPKAIRDDLDLVPDTDLSLTVEGDTIRLSRLGRPTRRLAFTDDGRPYFPAPDDVSVTDLDVQRLRDADQR